MADNGKHIVFVNTTPFWGGGERRYYNYMTGFADMGYRVTLLARRDGPLWNRARETGLRVEHACFGNLSFLDPIRMSQAVGFLKRERPDAVFTITSNDMKTGSFAARLAGVPRIVYSRGLALPVRNTPLNRLLFTRVITHMITNSKETRRQILKNFPGVLGTGDIRVVYNGMDFASYLDGPVVPPYERRGDEIVIGNAGRLTRQKGQGYLLELAVLLKKAELPFRLLIAGTGDAEKELREKAHALGLEQDVLFLGFVQDVKSFMAALDIFVLPSLWEGFGYVLAEAMVMERPVVAFDITSNPEVVDHGETGYLVDFPDVEAMSRAVLELARDRDLREKMGREGKARVLRRYDIGKVCREIEDYVFGEASSS